VLKKSIKQTCPAAQKERKEFAICLPLSL